MNTASPRRELSALLLVAALASCRDPVPAPADAPADLAADVAADVADAGEPPPDEPIEVEYAVAGGAAVRASLALPDPHTGLMGFSARYERSGARCRMLGAQLQGSRVSPRVAVHLEGEGPWPTSAGPHELSVSLIVPEACTPGGQCGVALRCRVAITQPLGADRVVAGRLVEPCAAGATSDGGVSVPAVELRALRFRALLRWRSTVAAPDPDAAVGAPVEPCG